MIFNKLFNNKIILICKAKKTNYRVVEVYSKKNRAISSYDKNFVVTSNIPLVSFSHFVIDTINW